MAMGPERSKPLHNFSMPCLKWGHQRFLRCVKGTTDEEQSPLPPLDRRSSPPLKRKATAGDDIDNLNDNIDAVREKLMVDLRVEADKLKVSIFEEGEGVAAGSNNSNNPRPWNLRTRRAACKAPEQQNQQYKNNLEAVALVAAKENNNNNLKVAEQKKINDEKKPKFCVSLSKAEVEQDYWALVGTRPPRRPKKRPRIVQRQLDTLFPGLWLTEVTAESYKVPDVPDQ